MDARKSRAGRSSPGCNRLCQIFEHFVSREAETQREGSNRLVVPIMISVAVAFRVVYANVNSEFLLVTPFPS